jgi:photosystem II stability/assembly factor-like uncharacterized protein
MRVPLCAAGLAAAIFTAFTPSASTAGTAAATPQSLRQVWTISADTAWAWTEGETTGSPQALERTANGGKTWSDVTPPGLARQTGDHFITGVYALDASHAWVTYGSINEGTPETVVATSDGGSRWTTVGKAPLPVFNGSVYNCSLDFVTAADGWCLTTPVYMTGEEAPIVYRTTDGGKKWQLVLTTGTTTTTPPGSLPLALDKNVQFSTPELGWAVFGTVGAATAPLYETVNGGKTWLKRKVATAPGHLENGSGFSGQPVLAAGKGAVGYTIDGGGSATAGATPADAAPGEESVVYVTTDSGVQWHAVTPPGKATGWLVDAITPESWRLVAGDRILATGNAGKTWRTIKSDVTFTPLFFAYDDPTPPTVNFTSSQVGWVADTTGEGTTLWRTVDGGTTWHKVTVPGT